MKKRFFTFSQNNSGGYFVEDNEHGVCEYVIIEADNAEDAWNRLVEIGDKVDGFWVYCSCCGERWYPPYDNGDEEPMIHGEPLSSVEAWIFRTGAFVHYADGSFKRFSFS